VGFTCSLDIVMKGKISASSTKEALIFQPSLVWLSQCLMLYCLWCCVDIWIMKVFCMRFQVFRNVTLICRVSGSQHFEGILSLHIQASCSLRKTTSAGLVTHIVVSVGGWLEGVAISVTVGLTTPFKGHTITSWTFLHPQLAHHPHQPSTKQCHYDVILTVHRR
jgi:hypothetical protein